jgi:D-3-phosphoglycerate dehydrogenase
MKKVVIPTKLDTVARDLLVANGFTVVQDSETPMVDLLKANSDCKALIVRSEEVTAEIIDMLPNLKTVIRAGAGFNTIDIKYARKKNVDVMNTPGANSNAVAEEVIAMILAVYRHVVPADISTRAGGWEKKAFMGSELTGKTIGIVGLGNIGQLVAKRTSGFEVKILAFDPIVSAAVAEDVGAKLVSLEQLFTESDVITLHIPENDSTRGMINASLLKLVKPGCLIINCARAGIINENDLKAMKPEKKFKFCTDVYPKDEPGEKSIAEVADLMLPHLGANTREANFNAAKRAGEQAIAYFANGVDTYVVNKGVPKELNENYQQLAHRIAALARHYVGFDRPVKRIACSFYGELNQFSKWFIAPVCSALSCEFEINQDPADAKRFLEGKGVEFIVRSADDSKQYGNSMTIDFEAGGGAKVSIRGTVAENNIMISRLNDYNRLYFVPRGNAFFVEYKDRPGVLSKITGACANAGLNIEDIHAPRDKEANTALAVLMTDKPVPQSIVDAVKAEVQAKQAFAFTI